ncbi:MAG: type III-B CRISPR module-associated protein Cmr5 [Thermoproteota archaeon]
MDVSDHVLSAIKDFENLLRSLEKEKKEESKVGESFRSRCRELPSLIEDVGLVPALSFCYAKAKEDYYKEVREALNKEHKIDDDNHIEKGYGIYLYFVLKRLRDLKLIEDKHLDEPIIALEEIGRGKQRAAGRLLRPYIVQMKKLSEAIFRAEGERR